jgi:phosphoribosylformylglycinamidine cyclo-ligase
MNDRSSAYKAAGVDIDAANDFVRGIKAMVGSTFTKGVVTEIGGFGGLFKPDLSSMEEPVLVASTDGVGTKLLLTVAFGRYDTIGIDLVAMSVNDILVQGARPLFFLDYLAIGKVDVERLKVILSGVVEGCRQAGCALLGGETAEMPDLYAPDEYDMSGFCVGLVDNSKIVEGAGVAVGDAVIGLAASGIHSNGYSLVRKLFDKSGLKADDQFPGADKSVAEVLLEPTAIYVQSVLSLMRTVQVKAMSHITGGGFYDNIPRVLPQSVACDIEFGSWPMLPVFDWLKATGELTWPEMLQIFNCSIGFVLVVDQKSKADVIDRLAGHGVQAYEIGTIRQRKGDEEQVQVRFPASIK